MNLYQKIAEVRKAVEGLSKDKASYGYKYVTGNQILGKVSDKMNELNLLLIPSASVGDYDTHNYTTAKGESKVDFIVYGEMAYQWINADEPTEKLVIPWAYYGQQDDISKAFGSALTYSERYFWLKILGLPTDEDDPDGRATDKVPVAHPAPPPTKPSGNGSSTNYDKAKELFKPKGNGETISVPQQKRLFALSGGDKDVFNAVLLANGYETEADIPKGPAYEKICQDAQNMLAAKTVEA